MDPGSTSVQVTVCESSTSLHIKKFGDPVDNVIKFWKDSPNGVSSPRLTVICPAVVGDTFAPPVATSVPKENVAARLLPDCEIVAPPVTEARSFTLAENDEPDTNGDPTFCTPPPLTEATANSAIDPCPNGIY